MALKVRDILASTYVLLDNADEHELDLSVALEMLGSVLQMMKYEQIFGNLDDIIIKESVEFNDTTGIVANNLTNFGDVVYLKFNNDFIDESTVNGLQLYEDSGLQRVAFWTDASDNSKYIQLAIPQMGTLDVWYEPDVLVANTRETTLDFTDSLKWCIVARLADACIDYTKYKDEYRIANRPNLKMKLAKMAEDWKSVYLEKVNRIGTNKPFQRLPYMSGVTTE